MAQSSNNVITAVGIVLLIGGAGLGYWGYEMSESLGAQLSNSLTGAMPDAVMYRYIGGAAAFAAGLFLIMRK